MVAMRTGSQWVIRLTDTHWTAVITENESEFYDVVI